MKFLRRMLSFVGPYKRDAVLASLALLGVVAADLGIPRLTQRVIDQGINAGDMSVVVVTSLLMLVVAIASAAFSIANTILAVRVSQHVGADIRSAIVRKVQTFSFGNLDELETGKLVVRATSDASQVQTMFMMALRIMTRAPLWLLGSVVMLAINSPDLVPLMVVLMAAVLVLTWFFLVKARPLFAVIQQKLDRLNQVLQENLSGIRVVKAFARRSYELSRFDEANDDLMVQQIRVSEMMAFLFPTMMLIINVGIAGVIWLGGAGVEAGTSTIGEIVASFNYLTFSLFPMIMLAGMMPPPSASWRSWTLSPASRMSPRRCPCPRLPVESSLRTSASATMVSTVPSRCLTTLIWSPSPAKRWQSWGPPVPGSPH